MFVTVEFLSVLLCYRGYWFAQINWNECFFLFLFRKRGILLNEHWRRHRFISFVLELLNPVFQMVRGVIVAPSQVFAVDNTMFGSVVYLAILLFSPTMAAFSFLGALVGCFAGTWIILLHDYFIYLLISLLICGKIISTTYIINTWSHSLRNWQTKIRRKETRAVVNLSLYNYCLYNQ